MTDLRKLIETVDGGGRLPMDGSSYRLFGDDWLHVFDAYNGSLDAAKALHDALLPGWLVQELSQNSRSMGWNMLLVHPEGNYISSHYGDVGFINCPARAWLLAILKACEAQQ